MRDKLLEILENSSAPGAMAWLKDTISAQSENFEKRPFYYSFSGVSRHFEKSGEIDVSPEQFSTLEDTASGFSVEGWDQFRLARVILLLVLAEQEQSVFLETLAALRDTADLRESAAIFSAYPLLPHQDELVESAVDGLRTNIVDVFDSIALNNPFPLEHFSDEEWNQMILKAIFIARPLHRIVGFGKRSNDALAKAISDLAHERWAAGRAITPEAWRFVIGHLDESITADIARLSKSEDPHERTAAALVVSEEWRNGNSDLSGGENGEKIADAESGKIDWVSLGKEVAG